MLVSASIDSFLPPKTVYRLPQPDALMHSLTPSAALICKLICKLLQTCCINSSCFEVTLQTSWKRNNGRPTKRYVVTLNNLVTIQHLFYRPILLYDTHILTCKQQHISTHTLIHGHPHTNIPNYYIHGHPQTNKQANIPNTYIH